MLFRSRLFLIFQTGSRIGQTDFSRQSDKIRVFIDFHGSETIQTVCLGFGSFWLNFDQANASLAFDQELGFLCVHSQKELNPHSAFQVILRCGLKHLD